MTAAELSESFPPVDTGVGLDHAFDISTYRGAMGWPVDGDDLSAYLEIGQQVGGLRMRSGLGAEVQWWLRLRMLSGPVLANPNGERTYWTFLTQPTTDEQRGKALPPGVEPVNARVLVPTMTTPRSMSYWATAPEPAHPALPLHSSVIGAVRSVLYGHRF